MENTKLEIPTLSHIGKHTPSRAEDFRDKTVHNPALIVLIIALALILVAALAGIAMVIIKQQQDARRVKHF